VPLFCFFFQAEDGIRDGHVTGVQTCALPISILRLRRKSTPLVRKIAAEHQVDIATIPGTGFAGRVTKQDILGYIERSPTAPVARSEERRVGKEWRSRWGGGDGKKNERSRWGE